jgi:hypothetical protein
MKKYTFEELQAFPVAALEMLKLEHRQRISTNETQRQGLIRDVMLLQEIVDDSTWRRGSPQERKTDEN